jgi:protein SCO1
LTAQRALLVVFVVAVPVVAGWIVVAREGAPAALGRAAGPYRGSEVGPKVMLPDFRLREWDGALVSSADLRNKVALVTFLETKCDEACPVIADQIRVALTELNPDERRQVYAIAVSTHPGDDTPASVREFLRRHRIQGALHYVIGSEAELRPVWRSFYVLAAFDSGDADTHSAPVRIFNRDGRWVSTLHPGVDLTPENLSHDVRVALEES